VDRDDGPRRRTGQDSVLAGHHGPDVAVFGNTDADHVRVLRELARRLRRLRAGLLELAHGLFRDVVEGGLESRRHEVGCERLADVAESDEARTKCHFASSPFW
jgi:hypothetical protein